jgi:hypothetical protein
MSRNEHAHAVAGGQAILGATMSKRYKKKLAPFVALFRHTVKSAAWRELSVGARATFLALKTNYNTNAQNAVFLSARDGARELGVHKNTVCKWHRELEHYGFIVPVQRAHLGVEGEGKATLYRLTDCPFAGKLPTYDFEKWDGELFNPKRTGGRNWRPRKQNPVRREGTPRPAGRDIRTGAEMSQNGNKRPTGRDIRNDAGRPAGRDITSLTSSLLNSEVPVWSTPVVEEVPWSEHWAQVYRAEMAAVNEKAA